jgi:hypothetical protein
MHGADAVVEEILDWRPYHYVTDRTILETPGGPVRLLHTVELEPVTDGTVIHLRYAPPRTRREVRLMSAIGSDYEDAVRAAVPTLVAQLEADVEAIVARGGPEPEPDVARPSPTGPLAGLRPLQLID